MKDIVNKLKEHQPSDSSRWREDALWRKENKFWLRYSQTIAMKMLDKMEELGVTQKELASRMGCSQQYISKVLKGNENLSLETIRKIEESLDLSFFNFRNHKSSTGKRSALGGYGRIENSASYLQEASAEYPKDDTNE